MLTERQLEVVLSVVYEYIRSGESVGSRTVSKRYLTGHSAATIRNEMSDLEDLGFLSQPHASAGRVPTTRAYRLYVDSVLQRRRIAGVGGFEWPASLRDHRNDMEGSLSVASDLLSRLTQYVGVAALAPLREMSLQRVDFLRLDTAHALVIVVLQGGLIHHRTVTLPCDLSQDALDELSRRINLATSGRTWEEVRTVLQQYLLHELEEFSRSCRVALGVLEEILAAASPRVFTGTVSQMLNLPDFQDLGRLQALVSLLEQESGLADMVARCSLEQGVKVVIGEESDVPEMKECSLVLASSVHRDNRAILGIIGPRRMDYERVISVLEEALTALSFQEE